MSKLVSVKISKAEATKHSEPSTLATEGPRYPWGLSINLDEDTLETLDLDIDDFKVGGTMTLIAKVEVTGVSSSETQSSGANENVSLQITDLCLEDGASKAADATAALYKE